jgi:hypothetical protein
MPDTDTSLIVALPDFLTWQSGNDLTRAACKNHVHYVFRQVKQWSSHSDTDLLHSVTSLPASSQQRLLLAPRVYRMLRSNSEPGADEIDSFKQFVGLERYLCNQESELPHGSWTALLDFYLAPEKPVQECTSSLSFRGETFRAPKLGNIVLDAFRPFTKEDFPPPLGEVSNHTPEELEFITKRLEQALEQISRMSPTARTAVDALVQVISIVRAPQSKKGTQSFSNKPVIGRMGIANADSDRWSINKIAEAIVHETIHALIYKIELTNCLYLDDSIESSPLKIESPWSGRKLPVHSFVHACFVWFGLWSFWKLASPDDAEAGDLRSRAANGFLKGHPVSCLPDEVRDCIRPEVLHAIDRMYKAVVSTNNQAVELHLEPTGSVLN